MVVLDTAYGRGCVPTNQPRHGRCASRCVTTNLYLKSAHKRYGRLCETAALYVTGKLCETAALVREVRQTVRNSRPVRDHPLLLGGLRVAGRRAATTRTARGRPSGPLRCPHAPSEAAYSRIVLMPPSCSPHPPTPPPLNTAASCSQTHVLCHLPRHTIHLRCLRTCTVAAYDLIFIDAAKLPPPACTRTRTHCSACRTGL